ncbi:YjbF family lipoprotein [Vibrio sp. Of7-15]|uniref:YjbF family lipoprotein n=1 Tax=Vibrio sp. Of7-15 TaxID=2724879 RepID=UPI001EF296C0|nr:YjbF family lipoprotein [Vibrio sp. Of7-15]MCG7496834.1 YjbF family lipoprotein [Vibrio sp. Of7-15]
MFTSKIIPILLSLILMGCTQKVSDVNATIHEAIFGFDDIKVTKATINDSPYASSYVRIGNGPQIFMVLALVENGQQKWLSSDKAMLVTENGRIVKTLALPQDNLAKISTKNSTNPDFLSQLTPQTDLKAYIANNDAKAWKTTFDWMPNYRYGYQANITWAYQYEQLVKSEAWEKQAHYIIETVYFPSLNEQYQNHFWLDVKTNQVVRSIQYLGPGMDRIEMTILKPYGE